MRVEEIMTKDVCSCSPGMNAATAAEIMWTRNCGSLPIVEDGGRVVGIVTDRDLFLALRTSNRKPAELPVGEVMSKDLALCNPGNDVRIALKTMAQRQLRRLPVVDEGGALKGILSLGDIALRADDELSIDVLNAIRGVCDRRNRRKAARRLRACALVCEDHIDVLIGPYSSGLTMAVAEITEQYEKVLWNSGGSSDEIFHQGWQYVVGIANPASDYLRALPHWLAEHFPAFSRICVFYSSRGTFGWQVARGILESTVAEARESVELVPINVPLENHDTVVHVLFAVSPDIVVLAGSFQDEVDIMRTRPRWPSSVRAVASVAAGLNAFSGELAQIADGVLGPSQWEPGTMFPNIIERTSDRFLDSRKQCGNSPDYVAAGCFASGLLLSECIRRAASLDDEELRRAASELDCNGFTDDFASTDDAAYRRDIVCCSSAGKMGTK